MSHLRRAALGALTLLALAGCQRHGQSSGAPVADMTLKIYAVPAERGAAIQDSLDRALGGIDVKLLGGARAHVSLAGPGKLLVYAPRDTQASIGETIAALGQAAATQAAPVQLDVRFWVIDGEPGAGADDPALRDLAGSLDALRKTMGPLHFHLDQAASLVGTGNESASLTTFAGPYQRDFRFRADNVADHAAQLLVQYSDASAQGLGSLNTRIDAPFGHYTVLAQAPGACPAMPRNATPPACPDKPALRLLVVRVDRLPTKA